MDALNNLANQEIFNMAKSADSSGERIVGVITKCDAVSSGDEGPVRSLDLSIILVLIYRSSKSLRTKTMFSDMVGSQSEIDQPKRRKPEPLSLNDMPKKPSSLNSLLGLNYPRTELEFQP